MSKIQNILIALSFISAASFADNMAIKYVTSDIRANLTNIRAYLELDNSRGKLASWNEDLVSGNVLKGCAEYKPEYKQDFLAAQKRITELATEWHRSNITVSVSATCSN